MSEDEELPMVFLNSSVTNESTFSMPSADVLATQRARELECERELRLLSEQSVEQRLVRCDSSGSESDAVLAAAVTELSVRATVAKYQGDTVAQLVAALVDHLPAGARPLLEQPDIAIRLPELVSVCCALTAAQHAWCDEEVCGAGALLAAAALGRDCAARATARRALQQLLDCRATPQQVQQLCEVLLSALTSGRQRLELSDALQTGAGAGADLVAAQALQRALRELLGTGPPGATWRRLAPPAAYLALQLAGRRRAREGPAAADLLDLPPPPAHDHLRPDRLKVQVAMSKLRLLFRADK